MSNRPRRSDPPGRRADRRRAEWERHEAERSFLAAVLELLTDAPDRCRDAVRGVPGEALTLDYGGDLLTAVAATLEVGPGPKITDLAATIRRQADAPAEVVALAIDLVRMSTGPMAYALGIERHRRSVLEAYQDRRIADAVADLEAVRATGGSIAEVIAATDAVRAAATPEQEAAEIDPASALSVADQWAREEEERLIPTGLAMIDNRFGGGLSPGITAICAMPGNGKSALAGAMMLGAMLNDRTLQAIWFRGEMSNSLLWSRFLAYWSTLRSPAVPAITRREASKRSKAARKVNADLATIVGDRLRIVGPPITADRIAEEIERHRPGIAVLDYLQRTSAPGFQDKRSEIDHVLGVVSDLTTRFDLATIVVSSMAGSRNQTAEIGSLTKESNRLDFDAHTYLALWGEKRDRDQDPRPMRLEIAKGRTGGEGTVDVWFSGSGQTFRPQAAEPSGERSESFQDFAAFNVEVGA